MNWCCCFMGWLGVRSVVAVLAICSLAAQSRTQPLSPADWSTTVQETVRDILANMSAEEKTKIHDTKRESHSIPFDLGCRNPEPLRSLEGDGELMLSACGRPCHPDDASMKIMEATWDELHK